MNHFYVRRVDDPAKILASGHAEPGKYDFTGYAMMTEIIEGGTAIYRDLDGNVVAEEVQGPLPDGATFETLKTKNQLVLEGRTALQQLVLNASLALQVQFLPVLAQVNSALDMGLVEAAEAFGNAVPVDETTIPDANLRAEAAALKAQLMAGLQQLKALN